MRTLVIAAHPDDEVLGCGGTIVRRVQEGHEVFVAILGEGISSRYERREDAPPEALASLAENARAVGEFLGVTEVSVHDFPDNRFDQVPLLEVIKTLEGLLNRIMPKEVFTQHGGDLNIDHSVVFRATLAAARPLSGRVIRSLYAYEVPSSTEWAFSRFAPRFLPNTFVDISQSLGRKISAMAMYESEGRPYPHPRSPEGLRSIARRWGTVVGVEAAEAFELVWGLQ